MHLLRALVVLLLLLSPFVVRADEVSDFYSRKSENERKVLQENLYWLGYDPGPIDGDIGPSSLTAVRGFQWQNAEFVSGYCGALARCACCAG